MKILYITALFWPHLGGIETIALKYLPAMRERGYEFAVLTSFGGRNLPAKDQFQDIPIYRYPFLKAISDKDLFLMKKSIQGMKMVKQTFEPDLIHLHMSAPISFYHLKTLQAHPSPTLLTLHTCFGEFDGGLDTVLGQTLRAADWTTMVSNAVMADAVKLYPEISDCSSVIYNGMEYPQVSLSPLGFKNPRILGLGRLVRKKGFDLLIDAFSLLQERFPLAQLTLAGDGTRREELEQQVRGLGLQDSVKFSGQVHPQQVIDLINWANVVVIPSRNPDSFPTVALEAGLLGRPVVAAQLGGLVEMIVDQKTGLLVEPDDSQCIFESISYLFDHPEEAKRMGQAGYQRMKTTFSWNRFINAYDCLYCKLAKRSFK